MLAVYETAEFRKRSLKVLSTAERTLLEKWKDKLTVTNNLGKPLGPAWLREFKTGSKRIYFLAKNTHSVFIWVGTKQTQEDDIAHLRLNAIELEKRGLL